MLSTCQISDQLDNSNRNYRYGRGQNLPFSCHTNLQKAQPHYYNFIISQLWLTSHPRSTVVILDTRTPGTSRENFSEDADDGTRTRNPRLQTECSSHWAIQLKSYCWEGVEFIQLVYWIIIILSFLNCDWLLIPGVQWFYWTHELLVPVEKISVRMSMMGLELAIPRLQTECSSSSHWAIPLKTTALLRWEVNHCWEMIKL